MAAAIIKTMTASSRARLVNPAIIAASPVVVSRVNRGEVLLNYRSKYDLVVSSAKHRMNLTMINRLCQGRTEVTLQGDSSQWFHGSTCAARRCWLSSRDRNNGD